MPCPFFAHGGVAFDGDCGAASQTRCVAGSGPLGALRHPSPHRPPDPRRARKPTSGAVVPLNRVRTGGGRGASVPRPPGAGVPGWFGPGRRLGPPVALRHMRGWLVSARRAGCGYNAGSTAAPNPDTAPAPAIACRCRRLYLIFYRDLFFLATANAPMTTAHGYAKADKAKRLWGPREG